MPTFSPGTSPISRRQRRLDLEHDTRALRRHQRRIAHELKRIAKALLLMQQDRLTGEILAGP